MEKKGPLPIYVRVRHYIQTYFFLCDEYENCSTLYEQMAIASQTPKEKIKLYYADKVSVSLANRRIR